MSSEMESAYEDYLVQVDAEKISIPETRMAQIMAQLDGIEKTRVTLEALVQLRDRVAAILERFAKSGRYAHIVYDEHAGVYVFIGHDGTRTAHSPQQLDTVFRPRSQRPQSQASRLVR